LPQVFQRDNESIPTSDRIPVLPLRDVVIFPYVVIPLLVGRPASLAAIEAALAEDKIILLVAQRDGEKQEPLTSTGRASSDASSRFRGCRPVRRAFWSKESRAPA